MDAPTDETTDTVHERVFGRYAFQELIDLPIAEHCIHSYEAPPFMKRKAGRRADETDLDAYETDEEYLNNLRQSHFVNSLDHIRTDGDAEIQEMVEQMMKRLHGTE
ncbi:hypothetical protein XU18_1807 [Perkinsela sp. CCAP 1560/4]|nr:hypothetical protein XU18_1807 [Perkinsela sp. CCAP 1560/4]|eukprot:KNH07275.1 hypothetical protein XU18_1807 [Perkinsela sp. CCAP 1560/4]